MTRTIQAHEVGIHALVIDARRDLLATAGRDGKLRLWRLSTGDRLREIQSHNNYVQGLVFHPREDAIYSAGLDGAIRKWNLETGDKLLEWRASRSVGPESLAMHPSRDLIASAGFAVRLWNSTTGEPQLETAGQLGGIHTLKFTPDGSRLVTAGNDATVRVWDANTRRQLSTFEFDDSPVTSLDLTRNGKVLITANRYRSQVDLRFLANGVLLNTLKTEDRVGGAVVASPDGKWLAATSADRGEHGALTVWDLSKNVQHGHLRTHGGRPFFSRDGKQLLVVGGQIRSGNRTKCGLSVWDVESLKNTLTLEDVQGLTWISSSALSPGGADLILAGSSVDENEKSHHQLVFWDWSKNDTRLVVDTREHVPLSMAIAPNGESLLTSNAFAGEVCIWDPRDGSLRQTIRLCERGFGAVGPSAFTLDSKQAAVGMGNGTIYLLRPQEPLPNVARKRAVPPPVEEPKPDQWQALLGQPAPELKAAGWLFGEPTTLAALRGKWVAIYFWIDRESVQDMPGWMNMRECLGDQAPTVIVVNPSINGSLDDLRKYYDQDSREHWEGRGLPFRVLLDERTPNVIAGTRIETGGATFAAYRVMTSFRGHRPRSFALLIAPDGTVKGRINSGFLRPPTRELEALMGVKAAVPKWEKELLEQYALPDGVHMKHFPLPDSQARKDYCFFNYGSGQYVMAFRQGESTHRILTGREASLEFVLNDVVGIESYEFIDPGNVLARTIAGDWCSRPGTPPADLLQALEQLLNREPGWKLHFERVMVQQPVIVARGRWRQTALAGYEVKQGVFLTVDDVPDPSIGGGGSGTLDEMFNGLGGRLHFRFIKEFADAPKYDLRWQDRLASDMDDIRRRTPEGQEKLDRVLKNLARQTGLEMKIEEREVAAWRVTAE